jgi:hypothetical protein
MKTVTAVLLAIATVPLAACGGSTETTNAAATENVVADDLGNELTTTDDGFGNLAVGNDVAVDDAALDNAGAIAGNGLTAVDNSQ